MKTNISNMTTLPVRACSIECITNPEWGTFGVWDDHGMWYVIGNSRGSRVLSKDEAARFWRLKK